MMYGDYGWGAGNMFGFFSGGLMMLIFWTVLIWLIVWIVREVGGKNISHGKRAIEILNERYAKGEITKDEFESKKRDITE